MILQNKDPDVDGEMFQRKNDLVDEISHAIDELSNMRTLRELEKDTLRAQQHLLQIEKRNKIEEYRLDQANIWMQKIEEVEKEKCKKTAALLRDFEQKSTSGPFFESLLNILLNYQGTF